VLNPIESLPMDTSYLPLWNTVLTVAVAIGSLLWGWLVYFIKREITKVDQFDARLDNFAIVISAIQLDLAKNYATNDSINIRFDKVDFKLDAIFNRLDRKQDKP